jgi:Phage gp6-like head-tail connector protein
MAGWSNLTPDQVRTALRISDTSQDDVLAQLLPQAEDAVESYTKRKFGYTTGAVEYPRGGGESFTLRHRPVAATGLSVYLDVSGFFGKGTSAFAADTLLTEGTDYVLERDQADGSSRSGVVTRLGGGSVGGPLAWPWQFDLPRGSLTARLNPRWPSARGCVKVVYTHGYQLTDVPYDLQAAVIELTGWLYRNLRYSGPLQSEHLADYQYQLAQVLHQGPLELGTTRSLLAPYREVVI